MDAVPHRWTILSCLLDKLVFISSPAAPVRSCESVRDSEVLACANEGPFSGMGVCRGLGMLLEQLGNGAWKYESWLKWNEIAKVNRMELKQKQIGGIFMCVCVCVRVVGMCNVKRRVNYFRRRLTFFWPCSSISFLSARLMVINAKCTLIMHNST